MKAADGCTDQRVSAPCSATGTRGRHARPRVDGGVRSGVSGTENSGAARWLAALLAADDRGKGFLFPF
ncbi:uncharacterized protein M6B38_390820 [Iris pallida]|uniref:Uncharacterized protein n=1 Tax=Iris pallida TaxID=29817 RepID=A0AAX6FZ75_IRIPA|nr:uncharacterized protein M6B38_390820 [Iris pallida]